MTEVCFLPPWLNNDPKKKLNIRKMKGDVFLELLEKWTEILSYYSNKQLVIVERQGSMYTAHFLIHSPIHGHLGVSTLRLLWMELQWAWEFRFLFKIMISVLLDHTVIPFLIFWGTSIYFSQQLHHSAIKKKETMPHDTTWMNLENVMLSEISQSQQDKYCTIMLIWGVESGNNYRNRR